MKVPMFSIRDKLAGFAWPQVDTNNDTAVRNFAFAINNGDPSLLNFSPGDYDLYLVGYFDSEKGIFESTESGIPEFVISGTNVFNKGDK